MKLIIAHNPNAIAEMTFACMVVWLHKKYEMMTIKLVMIVTQMYPL